MVLSNRCIILEILEYDFMGEGWDFYLSRLEKLPVYSLLALPPFMFLSENVQNKGESFIKQL